MSLDVLLNVKKFVAFLKDQVAEGYMEEEDAELVAFHVGRYVGLKTSGDKAQ